MTLALYRKYRPQTFAEMVGQEHVTDALQQALRADRVHHAYLFSGPRGCGKTSSARILARSLNCEHGPTPEPCGRCEHCTSISDGSSLDVVEIDAASHGGVDDARDLRERAFFSPVSGRFKVYIVDEAHTVSDAGFNALLKVVEEPPPYLKFVFATTEPTKVITTIKSRTHHYAFRLVPPRVLSDHLAAICAREGVTVDPLVLPLVVKASGGSVRDALSVLDQLLAGTGPGGVTYPVARDLLGVTDAALLDDMVGGFAARDAAAVFRTISRLVDAGHDARRFAADLLERLRDLIVLQAVPDDVGSGLLDGPADLVSTMHAQAASLSGADLARAAETLHAGLTEMRGTTSPRLLLEVVCARILLPEASADGAAVLSRLERLERRLAIAGSAAADSPSIPEPAAAATPPATSTSTSAAARTPAPALASTVVPDVVPPPSAAPAEPAAVGPLDAAELRRVWPQILEAVKSRRAHTTRALLNDALVTSVAGGVLHLEFQHPWHANGLRQGTHGEVLREVLAEVLGVDWQIVTAVRGQPAATQQTGGPAGVPAGTEDDGVSPDDEVVTPAGSGGQDSAVALLQSGLGAKVIGEIDAH